MNPLTEKSIERFLKYVRRDSESDCWLWTGAKQSDGYGQFGLNGTPRKAHRVAYTLWRGTIPENLLVCHTCDHRNCVNPAHLFLGTPSDNAADMKRKGRAARGKKVKLTDRDVREIQALRERGVIQPALASRFGVARQTITRVTRRRFSVSQRETTQ